MQHFRGLPLGGSTQPSLLPLVATLALYGACASATGTVDTGEANQGGQPAGGMIRTGGSPSQGGAIATGGASQTGGSRARTGGVTTGGRVTGGGKARTGGQANTGGTPSNGGTGTCSTSPTTQAITSDLELPPGPNYAVASFRLWYPKGVDQVKGILVLLPGSNADGRSDVNASRWQTFATAEKLALLGCFFQDSNQKVSDELYAQAALGSGQALVDAITTLSTKTDRCELANAPLLLWGFSAGGQFAYDFACFAPERVIAFVVNKGGYYHPVPPTPEAMRIPALMFIGGKDLQRRIDAIDTLYSLGRAENAPWALTVERTRAHEPGDSVSLAQPYFHAILPQRLSGTIPLPGIDQSEGYIGDLDTRAIEPASATPPDDPARTAWLPDKATATLWQTIVKK